MSFQLKPSRSLNVLFIGLIVSVSLNCQSQADDASQSTLQTSLKSCRIKQGIETIKAIVTKSPQSASDRAALGILKFFYALEGIANDYYRYGVDPRNNFGMIPGVQALSFRTPVNPKPESLGYQDARDVFERFQTRLKDAQNELNQVQHSGLKFVINLDQIFLDIDGNGKPSDEENVVGFFLAAPPAQPNGLEFAFDDADIAWLIGYTHVLMGVTDVVLAYDWQELFERTAHLVCAKPKTKFPFLEHPENQSFWNSLVILDWVAAIHLIRFELKDAERMKSALSHFESVISTSRKTWRLIMKETDDDREWLPGPTQHSLIIGGENGGRINQDWERVLVQAELLLKGERLLPFWRGPKESRENNYSSFTFDMKHGVNVRKVFTNPRRLDLVLWVQGTDALDYLEEGPMIDMEEWNRIGQAFGGQLPFFMFWVN